MEGLGDIHHRLLECARRCPFTSFSRSPAKMDAGECAVDPKSTLKATTELASSHLVTSLAQRLLHCSFLCRWDNALWPQV